MVRRVYVRPTLLDGEPRLVQDRFGRTIKFVREGVLKTLDTHLSRAIKAGDLELVEQKKPIESPKGGTK